MNRLDFLGLNANQAACVLLYLIAVLWVLNFAARRAWVKSVLIVIEAALVVALAATMSRGGAVVLVCGAVYVRFSKVGRSLRLSRDPASAYRDGAPYHKILHWFSYSPLWRVALLLTSPGLWLRSAPSYVAQDASIGNRFELWKGAVKLIATSPLRGWGYYNTGASYMNWFQGVTDHTYYNGLVNSYLQIGAAFGLPVLGGVLAVLILALLNTHKKVAQTLLSVPVLNQTNFGTDRSVCATFISLLCFLWILIWMLNSCFSSMLSSPMLVIPPLMAVFMALFLNPPRKSELVGSLMISLSLCLLVFVLGRRFSGNDSVSISRDSSGIITVANNEIKTGKTCILFVDQQALGEEYGKELRQFLLGADFERCVVVGRTSYFDAPETNIKNPELIIISGITVSQVEIRDGPAKYLLLNPAFLPADMPSGAIQAIVYPEINWAHSLEPDANVLDKYREKIRVVPYNECFETSWSEYLNTDFKIRKKTQISRIFTNDRTNDSICF